MRPTVVAGLGVFMLSAAPAWAEAPAAKPPSAEAESPHAIEAALSSARQELMALVDQDAQARAREILAEDRPATQASQTLLGPTPSTLTSTLPQVSSTPAKSTRDLSWLEGLKLPDFPVRWDDRLVRALEYYRDDPRGRAHMRGLLARRGRYATMIREKLSAAKVPEDLVYVAMVESAYEPTARSEVGALGLWQFMSSPAGDYGLEISRWVDQRMNPEASTDAAAKYFTKLYADLGSWPLAIAAYNMGYGALLRSMQKYNSNDFWLLSSLEAGLPYETITYVNKITACAIVGRNPERFGITDLKLDAEVRTTSVEVPGGTGLARIAHTLGMEPDALAQLNPELKKTRIPPDVKAWSLRIPTDRVERFESKWKRAAAELPSHRKHVLKLGERLSDLATIYDTTVAKLRKLNELEDSTTLRAGATLLVPDVEPAALPKAETTPLVGIPGDVFVYSDRKRVFYRTADGDSLDDIAGFFRINPDEIRMWNSISTDARMPRGMYLQLFVPDDADLSQSLVLTPEEVRTMVVGSEEFFDFHETQQNRVRLRYRVKSGDTLRSLAERFELSVGSIARINQFSRDKKLEPDSEIIVYVPEETAKRLASK
jgi:membrane-bound lytic murein transglycosylase D